MREMEAYLIVICHDPIYTEQFFLRLDYSKTAIALGFHYAPFKLRSLLIHAESLIYLSYDIPLASLYHHFQPNKCHLISQHCLYCKS